MRPSTAALLALACSAACAHSSARSTTPERPDRSALLPWSQQIAIRESWLEKRHGLLLGMMRRQGVSMWITVNEEFHDDPLTEFIAPARPYAGGRDIFVFIDAGDRLRRVALTGFSEEALQRFFEAPEEPRKQKEALAELFAQHQPKAIALATDGKRGVTRSLTRDSYKFLVESMGPEAEKRFVPAGPLIEEYLDTRIPEEREHYTALCELTEGVVREALSSSVVTPGKTKVGDIRRWMYDRLWDLGVRTWFQPDLRVQRQGMAMATSRGFLAVARESEVIQRGDVVHVDFGISHMGLHSDWQKMAYVLREGEQDAPAGLKAALANTHTLQDSLMQTARPGKTSAEVYDAVMAAMKARGIEAQIYSHPLGNQGHALGPSIDFRSAARNEPPRPLRPGSYIAIELNTLTPIPEWNGEKVFVMQEDPAELTPEGYRMFRPRQEAYYLIK